MRLTSVHPASAAFTEIAMKLPAGRLYASGKAFVPPIRRDLVDKLNAVLAAPGDESQARRPNTISAQGAEQESLPEELNVRTISPISSGLPLNWDSIEVGHIILAEDGPESGWWPCLVLKREDDVLTLRLRDYPKQGTYIRHITQVALINPGPLAQ
jgi:hypothetical protein